jgi:hypothetical protein
VLLFVVSLDSIRASHINRRGEHYTLRIFVMDEGLAESGIDGFDIFMIK